MILDGGASGQPYPAVEISLQYGETEISGITVVDSPFYG